MNNIKFFQKRRKQTSNFFYSFFVLQKVHKKKIITFVVTIDKFSKDCHPTHFLLYNVQSGTGYK